MATDNQSNNPGQGKKRRVRGSTASRVKLDKAMIEEGFSAQIDIARKIAENEGLTAKRIPKDMVNRVFSGKSVDAKSFERVAKALKVEAFELYLNAKDREILDSKFHATSHSDDQYISSPDASKNVVYMRLALVMIVAILALSVFIYSNKSKPIEDDMTTDNKVDVIQRLPLNTNANVAIHPQSSWPLADPYQVLSSLQTEEIKFELSAMSKIMEQPDAWKLPEQLSADFVLNLAAERVGRFVMLKVNLYSKTSKQTIYVDIFPRSSVLERSNSIYEEIAIVLSNALNIVPINGKNINAVAYSEGAANAAIHGFLVMEKGLSMNALAVSMMHFNRSLELKPDYLRAQIGLCKGLVGLYLLRQTPNTLKSAEKSCNSLSESAARDIDYLLSMSTLMRSQRMLDEAKTFVDIALTLSANNVDSLLTAAETELRLLIQTQDKTHFKNAVDYIDLAIENEPTYWKPLFVKSRAYYFTGQIPKAIAYVRSSVELEENFNNLSNLATLNFCFGEAQQTKEYYLKASTSVYADSLIKYNLAAMYSYFEQYDLASYEMDKYLSDLTLDGSRGQIESLIGAGDIYLDNQEYQKAQSNYQQAFVGLEALLRVSPEALDLQLLQLHSEIGLASLPNNNIDSQNATLVSKLDEIQSQLLDPINQVRILLLYISLDEIDKARLIYPKIVPVCKGFAESPRIVAALGI